MKHAPFIWGREDLPWCPWCPHGFCRFARIDDDGVDYRCVLCGKTHCRKDGSDEVFFFSPWAIRAACANDVPPWWPD
jgi:hypothetical protein